MVVELVPEAADDLEQAHAWYAGRSIRVSRQFLIEVTMAIDAIRQAPERWPSYDGEFRRCRLKRFPYAIVYRVQPEKITVLAIAHGLRRPGYWAG